MIRFKQNSRYFWLAAAILWMTLIFGFSHQKAEDSSEISGSITYRIAEGVSQALQLDWKEDALLKFAEKLQYPVRKMAHMTEYAILGWILLGNGMQYAFLKRRAYLWAWLGTTLYAATDEFHQLFIEGRSGEVKDVCIDGMGACIGLILAWGLMRMYRRVSNRRSVG